MVMFKLLWTLRERTGAIDIGRADVYTFGALMMAALTMMGD